MAAVLHSLLRCRVVSATGCQNTFHSAKSTTQYYLLGTVHSSIYLTNFYTFPRIRVWTEILKPKLRNLKPLIPRENMLVWNEVLFSLIVSVS